MTSKKEEREVDLLAISLVSVLITLEDYHCSMILCMHPIAYTSFSCQSLCHKE